MGLSSGKKILFIDDDVGLQSLLKEYFKGKGFDLSSAYTGQEGLNSLSNSLPDIVILDLMLPETDGFEVLRSVTNRFDVPVIMLTAVEDETDRIVGLEMGADDYLHKPINPRELLARIKTILRRTHPPLEKDAAISNAFISPDITVDMERSILYIDGNETDLTQVEFDIVHTLIQAKGRIVTRDQLMTIARGRDFEAFDRSIDVHISRIRKKIERDPAHPDRIKTIWGKGYKWEDEPE